jgi:hypothetical protein
VHARLDAITARVTLILSDVLLVSLMTNCRGVPFDMAKEIKCGLLGTAQSQSREDLLANGMSPLFKEKFKTASSGHFLGILCYLVQMTRLERAEESSEC